MSKVSEECEDFMFIADHIFSVTLSLLFFFWGGAKGASFYVVLGFKQKILNCEY